MVFPQTSDTQFPKESVHNGVADPAQDVTDYFLNSWHDDHLRLSMQSAVAFSQWVERKELTGLMAEVIGRRESFMVFL